MLACTQFPALRVRQMYLLQVLIGSLDFLCQWRLAGLSFTTVKKLFDEARKAIFTSIYHWFYDTQLEPLLK